MKKLLKLLTVLFSLFLFISSVNAASATISVNTSASQVIVGNNVNVSYQKNTYIYFLCPDQTKTQIQQYATGQWNNVDTTYVGTTNLTLATGATVEYHAYRTPKLGVTDSGKFQIK